MKILVIGPFPEPIFGVSLSNVVLTTGLRTKGFKVKTINTSTSKNPYTVSADCGTVVSGTGTTCLGDFHIANVAPGECMLTITDANGCSINDAVFLTNPACANLTIAGVSAIGVSCNGDEDGSIIISIAGGNAHTVSGSPV